MLLHFLTIEKLLSFLRVREWFFSVFPLVLAGPLYSLLSKELYYGIDRFLFLYICFGLFSALFLAFGYLINDFSDQEEDMLAGKEKVIYDIPDSITIFIVVFLVIAGLALMAIASTFNPKVIIATLITYVIGASYSLPGIRLKTRGMLGILCSSFAQRGMPIVLAGFLFGMAFPTTVDWVLLSLLNGIRYILIHQMIDCENDAKTATETFAQHHALALLKNAVRVILIVEVILLIPSAMLPLYIANPQILVCGLLVYACISSILYAVFFVVFGKKDLLFTYDLVPLEYCLNYFIPIAAAYTISLSSPPFILIALFFVFAGFPVFVSKCKNLRYVSALLQMLPRIKR